MTPQSAELRPKETRRFAPVAVPKRAHAPEMPLDVSARVGKALEGALTADDSVEYGPATRALRTSVSERLETTLSKGKRWRQEGDFWTVVSNDGQAQTVDFGGRVERPGPFLEGVAIFRREDGTYGFVNEDGGVLRDGFDQVEHFDGGYALVERGGEWGAINLSGGTVPGVGDLDVNKARVQLRAFREHPRTARLPLRAPATEPGLAA